MSEASIPVELLNPGQVFACLGFLEAADLLLGDAEGGFDWSDEADVRFRLRAAGNQNPFAEVLRFLATAQIYPVAPIGYVDTPEKSGKSAEDRGEEQATALDLKFSDSFPCPEADRMALPICLADDRGLAVDLGHWIDGSTCNEFKLYAGNRSAHGIARAMLRGTSDTHGVHSLWLEPGADLATRPFDMLTPMGGSFNFDPRGAWKALDAGYSPNQHKHRVEASPIVEILAVWGLEYARPDEYETRKVRYGVWHELVPPILARPALAGVDVGVPVRKFRFVLNLSGKNKVVTFAQEEVST